MTSIILLLVLVFLIVLLCLIKKRNYDAAGSLLDGATDVAILSFTFDNDSGSWSGDGGDFSGGGSSGGWDD